MSEIKDLYSSVDILDGTPSDKYELLSSLYFDKHGVTFENFVVQGNDKLTKKALVMLEAVFNGLREAPITNKQLGITKPDDALF